MYYKLHADLSMRSGYIGKKANKHETLMTGSIIDENQLTLPWPFTAEVDPEENFEMGDYYPGAKLMSKRLVETLRANGVDNLQTFQAEITNSETGEIIRSHLVVNIIGMVSCANLEASDTTPLADVKHFHKLVIDPIRTSELLMFRLAESRRDVIVTENIAKAIKEGNFLDVTLEPLQEEPAV